MRLATSLLGLALVVLLATPATAGSQSSNTWSNCSNGICTRTDTLVIEDRYGRRGWTRTDVWDERPRGYGYRYAPSPRHRHGARQPEIWLRLW
jgi:hypothetical protein